MAKRKAVKGSFSCPKCDRTFSMAAHLARHMSSIHAVGGGSRKKGKKKGRVGKAGPRRVGRPKGIISRLGLGHMSLEELGNVIDAAREEAQRKISDYQRSIG